MRKNQAALTGIRIIAFGHYIADPLSGMLLADQGAEIIKIDRPGTERTPQDAVYNRNKKRLELDNQSLHTGWLFHGSEPNMSTRRRCGLTMRFVSADVRALEGWNNNSVICRGSDPSGHWVNHLRPSGEQIPQKKSA